MAVLCCGTDHALYRNACKAKYSGLSHMPYANPHAPKGGMLSQSSNGTFDNLNSMNGKGSSTEGVNYLFDSLMDLRLMSLR
jgi:microcin C transport system substrate-binding protein